MEHNKNIMLTIYIDWNLQITLNLFKIIYFFHRKHRIPRICVRSARLQNVNKALIRCIVTSVLKLLFIHNFIILKYHLYSLYDIKIYHMRIYLKRRIYLKL